MLKLFCQYRIKNTTQAEAALLEIREKTNEEVIQHPVSRYQGLLRCVVVGEQELLAQRRQGHFSKNNLDNLDYMFKIERKVTTFTKCPIFLFTVDDQSLLNESLTRTV